MANELVPVEQQNSPALFDQQPAAMVANATEIANVLSNVIKQQKLSVNIQGNEYVKNEGWNCLGSLLGILPREREVRQLEDGSFEAYVELISHKTGAIVGCGSALCSVTEPRWKSAPLYARRSMAITRATGKAYRLGLSWIVTLAGYQPTPAEEMFDLDIPQEPKPTKKTAPKKEFKPNPEPVETIPTDAYMDTPENKRLVMNHFANLKLPLDKEQMANVHQMMLGKSTDVAEKVLVDYCKLLKERSK